MNLSHISNCQTEMHLLLLTTYVPLQAPPKDPEIAGTVHLRVSYTVPNSLFVNIKQAGDVVTHFKNKSCNPYAVVTLLGDYEVFKTKVSIADNWHI